MAADGDADRPEADRPEGRAPRGPSRTRRTAIRVAAVGGLFVLLALPAFSTLQPAYYGRYKDLRVRVQHWRGSTHAQVSCAGCHVEPGAAGLVEFGLRSIPAFYSQLLRGPSRTNLLRTPDRRVCRQCHTGYRQVSPAGDLNIPHRAHVEILKINCAFCHRDLVHARNERGFNRPRMTMCLEECHDGRKATEECVKCHTRKQTPDSHKRPDWLEIHAGMADKIDCGECHAWTPNYCKDCHVKRPSTHRGNWKKLHQHRAKRRSKGCLVCHGGEKFCKRCHD